ncbi:hypothetical protein [Ruegeria profundi]|uniref:hypothetical protein n=1 Tax=Ruegeria profundi TaxID=1685378 RepID=UPI000ABECF5F|nr:hypothetical protein [Ruegeria profundi]
MLAGLLAALSYAAAAVWGLTEADAVGGPIVAGFVFAAQIAYEGARAGRKTHLTDMDTGGRKAVYTALSNSLIGLLLLAGGLLGLLADVAGPEGVLALLALMSGASVFTGTKLSEVQREKD